MMVLRVGWRYLEAAAADGAGRGRRSLVVRRAVATERIGKMGRDVVVEVGVDGRKEDVLNHGWGFSVEGQIGAWTTEHRGSQERLAREYDMLHAKREERNAWKCSPDACLRFPFFMLQT